MSFWKSSAGEVLGTQESAFAKTFKNIPDGSTAVAKIHGFKNDGYNGDNYLKVDWVIAEGDFKGKHVFQKLKVFDSDEKKRLRALNMFMYMYKMYGISPSSDQAPTDNDLMKFVGKAAGIKIRETEPNEYGKQYNWVAEIHPAEGFKTETAVATVVTHVNKQKGSLSYNPNTDWDANSPSNDIPF
jgi:hypothetical protein